MNTTRLASPDDGCGDATTLDAAEYTDMIPSESSAGDLTALSPAEMSMEAFLAELDRADVCGGLSSDLQEASVSSPTCATWSPTHTSNESTALSTTPTATDEAKHIVTEQPTTTTTASTTVATSPAKHANSSSPLHSLKSDSGSLEDLLLFTGKENQSKLESAPGSCETAVTETLPLERAGELSDPQSLYDLVCRVQAQTETTDATLRSRRAALSTLQRRLGRQRDTLAAERSALQAEEQKKKHQEGADADDTMDATAALAEGEPDASPGAAATLLLLSATEAALAAEADEARTVRRLFGPSASGDADTDDDGNDDEADDGVSLSSVAALQQLVRGPLVTCASDVWTFGTGTGRACRQDNAEAQAHATLLAASPEEVYQALRRVESKIRRLGEKTQKDVGLSSEHGSADAEEESEPHLICTQLPRTDTRRDAPTPVGTENKDGAAEEAELMQPPPASGLQHSNAAPRTPERDCTRSEDTGSSSATPHHQQTRESATPGSRKRRRRITFADQDTPSDEEAKEQQEEKEEGLDTVIASERAADDEEESPHAPKRQRPRTPFITVHYVSPYNLGRAAVPDYEKYRQRHVSGDGGSGVLQCSSGEARPVVFCRPGSVNSNNYNSNSNNSGTTSQPGVGSAHAVPTAENGGHTDGSNSQVENAATFPPAVAARLQLYRQQQGQHGPRTQKRYQYCQIKQQLSKMQSQIPSQQQQQQQQQTGEVKSTDGSNCQTYTNDSTTSPTRLSSPAAHALGDSPDHGRHSGARTTAAGGGRGGGADTDDTHPKKATPFRNATLPSETVATSEMPPPTTTAAAGSAGLSSVVVAVPFNKSMRGPGSAAGEGGVPHRSGPRRTVWRL